MSQSSIRPLSVGNAVTTGLVMYRSNLKTYLKLSIFAYLWLLLPIYGWAKFCAIHGLIGRLAYCELINKPETVNAARDRIDPRLWSFLGVGFGIGLRLLGIYILWYLALIAVVVFPMAVLGTQTGLFVSIIAAIIVFIAGIVIIIRFYSRWFVAELPLAVEENVRSGSESIERSWDLTRDAVSRIQYIIVVAFLVTIPIQIVTGYIPSIFQIRTEPGTSAYATIQLISFLLSLLGGAIIMPFWQAVKAVIYYDLRSRREGLDLQLRDR
ncbi:hypothetical protein NIES2119_30750 [[Phormidium ambiguum] IAM M-71]|uniref:DUF7847 domain-containing protein n=1 Tax=[Phormidium ambiguum] IAM M-71 TaxID=454136 RepID=A0A1U7I344_9CYAN|nr:hypothetical protein [Phormidium ambiguum]OKH30542.1 hypothetical protein NIES2119_30750 [Phormidium ambiguum IAM M-71]